MQVKTAGMVKLVFAPPTVCLAVRENECLLVGHGVCYQQDAGNASHS